MSIKLKRNTSPVGHSREDFNCFGPPALKDDDFINTKIADMGCFTQDGKDTNKYYHGAVVQSKKNNRWFAYFEWGRTGATAPAFIFIECFDQDEAQREYCKQLRTKNVKRGQWITVAGIQTLQAKPGEDCYLVRPQATRSTGLPNAKTICLPQNAQSKNPTPPTVAVSTPIATKGKKAKAPKVPDCDPETRSLLKDLSIGTISYTKSVMADACLPTTSAIEEARQILGEAAKVSSRLSPDPAIQAFNRDLLQLTSILYGRIPKKKSVKAHPSTWVLNSNNIQSWNDDLDAFQEALVNLQNSGTMQNIDNPLETMGIEMNFLPQTDPIRIWLESWCKKATGNFHNQFGEMKIHNMWKLNRESSSQKFLKRLKTIAPNTPAKTERPHNQRGRRPDLPHLPEYRDGNGALLFHGSRSCNLSGLLRNHFIRRNNLKGVTLTGALLGNGIYFADDWKKSAGYTSLTNAYWAGGTGGISGRKAFMLVCSVALGNVHIAQEAHGYNNPPKGFHSVMGKPNVTRMGSRYLLNPEFVDYTDESRIDYVLEFEA